MNSVYSFLVLVLLLHLIDLSSPSVWTKVQRRLPTKSVDEPTIDEEEQAKTNSTAVVVLTSLSGIYVWWPKLFGGDDSFHLLLDQEDVPRFHDVTGDQHGNIYLTSPHERTVYQLKFADGWWIAKFSNHSVMNSIRSEMPLFITIHYVSSVLYVYGHSDIQLIDLLEPRPRTRGSAPFMRRLKELSPNLRISDLIIDQLTSEGYIIGDSYGWCTVIRCSLTVNECHFLFKIPSSYDNRPYPCTATIDFSRKILYLSLEEKILSVHLNEQTNYDRRSILIEKYGPRSTLGYDDIVVYRNSILYTDVLRPLLHLCSSPLSESCLNISLQFPSQQLTILPLRLTLIEVSQLRPPTFDDELIDEGKDQADRIHLNQTTTIAVPLSLIGSNRTSTVVQHAADPSLISFASLGVFALGFALGLIVAGIIFMFYYICCNKNRPRLKREPTPPPRTDENENEDDEHSTTIDTLFEPVSPLLTPPGPEGRPGSSTQASVITGVTTSSSTSYDPDIVL